MKMNLTGLPEQYRLYYRSVLYTLCGDIREKYFLQIMSEGQLESKYYLVDECMLPKRLLLNGGGIKQR